MADTPGKPKKATRSQRQIMAHIAEGTVRRAFREKFTPNGSTVTFYWATDYGLELSERVVDNLIDREWVKVARPDRKPQNVRELILWQTEGVLQLTDLGRDQCSKTSA